MSLDQAIAASAPTPESDSAALAEKRLALRLGFGVAVGFLLGELLGTLLFFLPPLLAVLILAAVRQPPTLRQGIGLVVLIALMSGLTLVLAGMFSHVPLAYVLLVALLLFAGFYLDSTGRALPATFLLILGCIVPVTATQSIGVAATLTGALIESAAIAVLTAWAMFAAFPATAAAATAPPPVRQAMPGIALANTLLLLPPLLWLMLSGQPTFVALIVIISILRLGERSAAPRTALGLLLGNVLGGLIATIAYGFVAVQGSIVFFLLVVLLIGLALGARIAAGGATVPVYSLALVTFIILLGIGVSPLPTDTSAAFTARLWNVMLAGVYAVGALSLLSARARQVSPAGTEV
jgi:hypothetical protein